VNATEGSFFHNVLLFTRTLYRAGIPVSMSQTMDFCQALTLIEIGQRQQVYHAARCLLITDHVQIPLFDTLFNFFWRKPPQNGDGRGQKAPVAPRHNRPQQHPYQLAMLMSRRAQPADREIELADRAGTFSDAEQLQRKSFVEMTPEELATVKRLMQQMRWQISQRQTRRWVPDSQGRQLHMRQMMRRAGKNAGIPLHLAWQSKKIKQRPLILIADISGSMEKYARLALQFCYSLSHSLSHVETFLFATRLTRITPQLRLKNIDRAIDDAAHEVVDWSGGTRIGQSIKTFNQQWSRRVLRRGAIVLIVSDGWERGDVATLATEMRYLQRRCHRLIWLNPLAGNTHYQPIAEGMAAALPYIDDFLPIHNLQSLSQLADHLTNLNQRRSLRRSQNRFNEMGKPLLP